MDRGLVGRRAIFTGAIAAAAIGSARAAPGPREQIERHLAGLVDAMKALHGGNFRGCIDADARMVAVLSDD